MRNQFADLFLGDAVLQGTREMPVELLLAAEREQCSHRNQAAVALRQAGALPDLAVDTVSEISASFGTVPRMASRAGEVGLAGISVSWADPLP